MKEIKNNNESYINALNQFINEQLKFIPLDYLQERKKQTKHELNRVKFLLAEHPDKKFLSSLSDTKDNPEKLVDELADIAEFYKGDDHIATDWKKKTRADRFKEVERSLGINSNQLATEIGVSARSVYATTSDENEPTPKLIKKVTDRFPQISNEWMMFGFGTMLDEDDL
tara:strand:- start:202 stop:711 length:510 start_codon:yes stop_codon:yes gene_type:complete